MHTYIYGKIQMMVKLDVNGPAQGQHGSECCLCRDHTGWRETRLVDEECNMSMLRFPSLSNVHVEALIIVGRGRLVGEAGRVKRLGAKGSWSPRGSHPRALERRSSRWWRAWTITNVRIRLFVRRRMVLCERLQCAPPLRCCAKQDLRTLRRRAGAFRRHARARRRGLPTHTWHVSRGVRARATKLAFAELVEILLARGGIARIVHMNIIVRPASCA